MTECAHHHGHHAHAHGDGRRLVGALIIISAFMVIEIVGGVLSGSLALIADATHMFTDALALLLAVSAQWLASRPADRTHNFGYRRTQVIAAFVNGVALVGLLLWIVVEAIRRFFSAELAVDWELMLTVAIIGFAANAAAFFVLHPAQENNMNVRGAMLHVISDLLGSVAAVVAAVVIAMTGWMRIDPVLSIAVAVLIGQSAWRLLSDTFHILMQGAPHDVDPVELTDTLRNVAPEIVDIHQLQIWQMAPGDSRLTMHLRINEASETKDVLRNVKECLADRYGVRQSTIQVEFCGDCPDCTDGAAVAEVYDLAHAVNEPAAPAPSRRPASSGPPHLATVK